MGVVLAAAALFTIVFGLIEGQRYSWSTVAVQTFDTAFIAALRPTVAAGVAVIVLGGLTAAFIERGWSRNAAARIADEAIAEVPAA